MNTHKSLIDKQLENSMHKIFNNLDSMEGRHGLSFEQFKEFLYLNCFDFIFDFCEPQFIKEHLFTKEAQESPQPRCSF